MQLNKNYTFIVANILMLRKRLEAARTHNQSDVYRLLSALQHWYHWLFDLVLDSSNFKQIKGATMAKTKHINKKYLVFSDAYPEGRLMSGTEYFMHINTMEYGDFACHQVIEIDSDIEEALQGIIDDDLYHSDDDSGECA